MDEVIELLNQLIDFLEESKIENKEDLIFLVEETIDSINKKDFDEALNILDDLSFELKDYEELYEIVEEIINVLS